MTERNIRQRLYANEGVCLAQATIPQPAVHCEQVTNPDRAILQRGVARSPNLVQHPLQLDCFSTTRFDYQMHFNTIYVQINLSAVMIGGDEQEKLALDSLAFDGFMKLAVPQPCDDDIVHLDMDNAGVGFTFSMDYAALIGWSFTTKLH